MNPRTNNKRTHKKYNIPVIGHFADKSIRFNSILEAERYTGINYTLIFEGQHYIKYKSYYVRASEQALEDREKK